ncbi:hypothetical protein KOEU_00150 [Komagataeibacter europaeus]|uniref:Uncharacterized protein n=1 Tax=Komagataeibacter europaeus TaxID=33995 RepID=A0A0M0ELA9_KOMEU|nr:hypothetical protein S101446_03147 [Komagataeibacter europaeus]KON66049.1 hypothetical protein KOEU_00150 [Komagataeibacter europaeus]
MLRDALSGNFFVKNVVLKHIFVVIMPLCCIRMTSSGLRNMHPLLLLVLFNPLLKALGRSLFRTAGRDTETGRSRCELL